MIGYGCGVSQYPQFYVKDLDMYQILPRPYIGSFGVFLGDNLIEKIGVRIGKSSRNIFLEFIETRITIDDIEKGIRSQYWTNLKENLRRQKKYYHQHAELGKLFSSMDVIVGRLLSNHHKNLNHVHKDSNDLVSVIITLG